ncbi:MAG: anti-sigma regulatory factor [Synechococcales cyanobacterium T60_A2020_003]|nr:anti-sigma regulatory factor [Synechococcales cyanobacterium T60_A2020_003]
MKTETLLHSAEFTTETRSNAVLDVLDWFVNLHPDHVSSEVWLECQTALIEGFDNAVRHAHKHLPVETPIRVNISIYQRAVAIQIWDQGHPIGFDALLQQTPETVKLTAESGRGLMLMRRVADYLAYTRNNHNQNCLLVIRVL